jgi:hypothetical protein
MKFVAFFIVGFACAAWGQATVETAVGAGAATGAAAGAKGAGQAVGGVFGAVSKVLDQAGKPAASGATATPAAAASSAPPAGAAKTRSVATTPIDPSRVALGMDRDQLIAQFGEPATRTTQIRRSQMIDTFWYNTTAKDELIITLTDGKVASTVLASQRKGKVASARR